ncbi:MAG TPA: glycosyltransferase family 39 protein [Vicinamibacterales bacterium]
MSRRPSNGPHEGGVALDAGVIDTHAPTFGEPEVRRWSTVSLFAALAILTLLLRLAGMTGLIGSDDLNYVKFADAVVEGRYSEMVGGERERHQGLRYAVILPQAAIQRTLGVSEWTTILLPLVTSTLSVLLLAEIGRLLFGLRIGLIAGLLYATFPIHILLGTILVPEPVLGFYSLAGVLCYLHAGRRGGILWFVAGMLMGAAYLAKEPAVFVGGAFLLHALWERRWRGAALFAAGMIIVPVLEHAYYYFVLGDLMFRPNSTRVFSLDEPQNIANLHRNLTYRLFIKYPSMMLVPNAMFALHSLVCVALAATAVIFTRRRGFLMLTLWAIVPWLYLNFGSWTIEHYAPMPTDPRYLELVYPPLMLLAAVAVMRALDMGGARARLTACSLIVVLVVGSVMGIRLKGTVGRAEQMAMLREISHVVRATPAERVYTDDVRWRRALWIYDASVLAGSPADATLIVSKDPVGLPALQRVEPAAGGDGGSR